MYCNNIFIMKKLNSQLYTVLGKGDGLTEKKGKRPDLGSAARSGLRAETQLITRDICAAHSLRGLRHICPMGKRHISLGRYRKCFG